MTTATKPKTSLTVGAAVLKAIIGEAGRFVASGGMLPVLGCVLLQADDRTLRVAATNLQAFYRRDLAIEGGPVGSLAVPYTILDRTLAGFADEATVALSFGKGRTLHLATERVQAEIKGLAADDFPVVTLSGGETRLSISHRDLLRLISASTPCAATDIGRPTLIGCSVEVTGELLTCFATDGHRLGGTAVPVTAQPWSVLLPAKDLRILARLLDDSDELVEIATVGSGIVSCRFGDSTVGLRIIDGQYPAWRKLVPDSASVVASATVSRAALLDSLRLSALYGRGASIDQVSLDFADDLTVSSKTEERGRTSTRLDAEGRGTDSVVIDAKVAVPVIESVSASTVLIETHSRHQPLILRDPDDANFLGLVMPVSVPA